MSNKRTEDDLLNMKPEDILTYLDDKLAKKPDVIPAGWYSLATLSKAWGISEQSAGQRVNKGVEDGLMAKRWYRVMTSAKYLRPVAHYSVVKK
jgi:hypothetical protein